MMKFLPAILIFTSVFAFTFCKHKNQITWLPEDTHGKSAAPNYSVVFPNDKVNRIDLKIDFGQWAKMQADLKSNIGETPRRMPPPPDKNQRGISESEREKRPMGGPPPGGHNMENASIHNKKIIGRMGPPPGGGRQGGAEYKPIWEYCDIYFNKQKWNKVGICFKGNSSLRTTYQRGIKKLSFKLDFDQFEDEFPEIKNQRFYGFKQLNLKNNYDDASFIREKVASDSFTEFSKAATKARTQFELMQNAPEKLESNDDYLFIKSEYKLLRVNFNDIRFIEGMKEYIRIHITGQKPVMTLLSMKSLEAKLPSEKFMRVHRSYIVNLDKITTIERFRIVFDDKFRIPVSDNYKEKFQAFFDNNFMG